MTPIQLNDRVQISDEGHRRGIAFRTRPGRSKTLVPYATVVGFSRDGSCAWVTPDGAKYRTRLSLDFLELAPDAGPAPEPAPDPVNLQQQLDAANQRISELEISNRDGQRLINELNGQLADSEQAKEEAERKLSARLAENNQWWEKRFDYFHRWAKTLPEPHITEFFDIAANGQVAEWRDRYRVIAAQIEARCTGSTPKPQEAPLLSLGEQDKLQG